MITKFEYTFIIIIINTFIIRNKKNIDSDIHIFTEIFSVIIDFTACNTFGLFTRRSIRVCTTYI